MVQFLNSSIPACNLEQTKAHFLKEVLIYMYVHSTYLFIC